MMRARSGGEREMGRERDRGEQSVSWTRLARVHMQRMKQVSVASFTEVPLLASSTSQSVRSSTLTSVWVAVGGRLRITVKKVSWRRTACQSLRRCCFSNALFVGVIMEGSRFRPMAYA